MPSSHLLHPLLTLPAPHRPLRPPPARLGQRALGAVHPRRLAIPARGNGRRRRPARWRRIVRHARAARRRSGGVPARHLHPMLKPRCIVATQHVQTCVHTCRHLHADRRDAGGLVRRAGVTLTHHSQESFTASRVMVASSRDVVRRAGVVQRAAARRAPGAHLPPARPARRHARRAAVVLRSRGAIRAAAVGGGGRGRRAAPLDGGRHNLHRHDPPQQSFRPAPFRSAQERDEYDAKVMAQHERTEALRVKSANSGIVAQVCTKPRFSRFSIWISVDLSAV